MTEQNATPKTWWYIWRIIIYRPWLYLGFGMLELLFFAVFPQLTALTIRAFFNIAQAMRVGAQLPG